MTAPANIEFEKAFSAKLTVHTNIGQEVIVTTVDKVKICLMENRECLSAQKEWVTPLSLFIALITTLAAAEFRKFMFEPAVWQAIYLMSSFVTFFWMLDKIRSAWKIRSKASIDTIVSTLKAQSPPAAS